MDSRQGLGTRISDSSTRHASPYISESKPNLGLKRETLVPESVDPAQGGTDRR